MSGIKNMLSVQQVASLIGSTESATRTYLKMIRAKPVFVDVEYQTNGGRRVGNTAMYHRIVVQQIQAQKNKPSWEWK